MKKKEELQSKRRVEREDQRRNCRNKGIWIDRGKERRVINEKGRMDELKEEQRHEWTWGREDERSKKELRERHMLGRGVKEGCK